MNEHGSAPSDSRRDEARVSVPGPWEGDGVMFRITVAYFVRLGEEIQRLRREVKQGVSSNDVKYLLYSARQSLYDIQRNEVLGHALRASYAPVGKLVKAIDQILAREPDADPETGEEPGRDLDFFDEYELSEALNNFYTVFSAELEVANAYLVLRKGGYDTNVLLFSGEALFPPDLTAKAPDALPDAQAAGQCLAFELGTACGFHTLRAVESVLIKYWHTVSGGKPVPEPRNLGNTLNVMDTQKLGDPKILAALKQIKDLHRNPLMHPEVQLDVTEAISLVGMAQSCIGAMLAAIPYPTIADQM